MDKLVMSMIALLMAGSYFKEGFIFPLCLSILFLAAIVIIDKVNPDTPTDVLAARIEAIEKDLELNEEKIIKINTRINMLRK